MASGRSALRMVPVVPAWVGVAQRSVAVVDSRHARKVGRERTGSWVTMRVETCANLVSVRSRGISSVVVEGDTWSRVACVVPLTKGTRRVRPRTSPVSRRVRGIIPRGEMGTGIDASPVDGRVLGLGFRVDGRVGTHRSSTSVCHARTVLLGSDAERARVSGPFAKRGREAHQKFPQKVIS